MKIRFPDPSRRRGRSCAKEWLRNNGFDLSPASAPDLGGRRPEAYGKRYSKERGLFEIVAIVETAESVGSAMANDRMKACDAWSGGSRSRRKILFVPRGSVEEAVENLAEYDAMVAY